MVDEVRLDRRCNRSMIAPSDLGTGIQVVQGIRTVLGIDMHAMSAIFGSVRRRVIQAFEISETSCGKNRSTIVEQTSMQLYISVILEREKECNCRKDERNIKYFPIIFLLLIFNVGMKERIILWKRWNLQ